MNTKFSRSSILTNLLLQPSNMTACSKTYVKVHFRSSWQLVDNGYQTWSTVISQMKIPVEKVDDRLHSWWFKLVSKEVECVFGILKGFFQILKAFIEVRSIHTVDNIWKLCCTLHNFLLEIDESNIEWQSGAQDSDSISPLPLQKQHHSMRDKQTQENNEASDVDNRSKQIITTV